MPKGVAIMPLLHMESHLPELAEPHLAGGEQLRQVFQGSVQRGLRTDHHVFAVTDTRVLVIDKKKGSVIAQLPRTTKFIPPTAGRFHLDPGSGGLAGLNYLTVSFKFPQYAARVKFGWPAFGAMLAADGREGEKHSLAKLRILH